MTPRRVTILGSTGSIGQNTLDVIARHPDRFELCALTADRNVALLAAQVREFNPRYAAMRDRDSAAELAARIAGTGVRTRVLAGSEGLVEVAADPECDCVMAAIVGSAGLEPTLAAVAAGKRLLLANKEALVMSGALFMDAVRRSGAELLPIDSEHNAIFQCLPAGDLQHDVRRILLTGSGGPLLREPLDRLSQVKPERACAHPNWKMGRKISVDSATMMNKGLEVIEATWLFAVDPGRIEVVIHPESIVHSMVEYADGSVLAQLGSPDMRTPIAHGLAWPERIESGVASLDFTRLADLRFEAPDLARYPCLVLAREAQRAGGAMPATLNAANEVAVQAYLDELICFTDIPVIIEAVLSRTESAPLHTLPEILEADQRSRALARELVQLKRS